MTSSASSLIGRNVATLICLWYEKKKLDMNFFEFLWNKPSSLHTHMHAHTHTHTHAHTHTHTHTHTHFRTQFIWAFLIFKVLNFHIFHWFELTLKHFCQYHHSCWLPWSISTHWWFHNPYWSICGVYSYVQLWSWFRPKWTHITNVSGWWNMDRHRTNLWPLEWVKIEVWTVGGHYSALSVCDILNGNCCIGKTV